MMKRNHILGKIIATLLCLMMITPSLADVLTLPSGTKVIEEYAFYGDTSIDEVVLPEGIEEIGEYAFAESGLTKINLPSSLEEGSIADNAIDKDKDVEVTAIEGTDAYDWAVENGFVEKAQESPLEWFEFRPRGDGTCYLTQFVGTEYDKDIVIPAKDGDGNTVIEISSNAFSNLSELTGTLTIPNGVKYIDRNAFYNCSGLTGNLIIPNSVTRIDEKAFANCRSFTGILSISNNLTEIDQEVFSNCSGLTGPLRIPDGVTSIGYGAFRNCNGFTGNLIIPNSVKSMGSYAFENCSSFTGTLTLPDNITGISFAAFSGCSGLTGTLHIPDSVTYIDTYAFNECSGFFGMLSLPENVISIGSSAFSKCTGFTGNLTIPKDVVYIGSSAFSYCTGFTGNLILGESVESIGDWAFYQCQNLSGTLTIPNSVQSIGSSAFVGCNGFNGLIIGTNVKKIGSRAFEDCSNLKGNLVIPGSVKQIDDEAFYGCIGFNGGLVLEKGVETIGSRCFQKCSGFSGRLEIPDSVISIGNYAFSNCSGFSGGLSLSDSITSIGKNAFEYCSGFTGTLSLPEGLSTISDYAFYYCSGFEGDLVIGAGISSIGSNAFAACTGFSGNLVIGENVTSIGDYAFYWCRNLTGELIIPANVNSIGSYAFSVCPGFFGDLNIPQSVTSLGQSAFYSCSGFTGTLTVPRTITEIDAQTFSGCSGFDSLVLPYGITSIGNEAFKDCSGLEGMLRIPSSVKKIGEYAFSGCAGFYGQLTIPDSVTTLGCSAFQNCSGFSGNLTISSELTLISENAFAGCSGLTGNLIIPDKVTTIDKRAFADCSGFSGILLIPTSVEEIGWDAFNNCNSIKYVMVASQGISFAMHYDLNPFTDCSKIEKIYCVTGGQTWTWFTYNGFSDRLVEWDGNIDWGLAEGKITGTVIADDEQRTPLKQALIIVSNKQGIAGTTISDHSGEWMIDGLTFGDYFIECYLYGYSFQEQSIQLAAKNMVTNPFIGAYTPEERPDLTFSMTPSQISVGEEITFSVSAPGATKVRLLIDGVTYDEDIHELNSDGTVTFGRKITKYADMRSACFIAQKDGKWTNASESQTIWMTTNGNLNPVQIDALPDPHRTGNDLEVTWTTVDHAEGFNVYLYNSDGEHKLYKNINRVNDSKFSVVIPSSDLPEGSYTLDVMAYGTGYSQSSSGAFLWVRPPYTEQVGWPQGERVPTYIIENGSVKKKGYVDYTESVRILDEIDGFYYIEMHRSPEYGGDYVRRYVKKDDQILVGNDESLKWVPPFVIDVSCSHQNDGSVKIRIMANGAEEAGVLLGDNIVDSLVANRDEYEFGFVPANGKNEYTAYAKKGEVNATKTIVIQGSADEPFVQPEVPVGLKVIAYPENKIYSNLQYSTDNLNSQKGVITLKSGICSRPYTINANVLNCQGLDGRYRTIALFSVNKNHQNGIQTYDYVCIQPYDGTASYTNTIKWYSNGNPVDNQPLDYQGEIYKSRDYEYLLVPVAFTERTNNSYTISDQMVQYLEANSSVVQRFVIKIIPDFEGPYILPRLDYKIYGNDIHYNLPVEDAYIARFVKDGYPYYLIATAYTGGIGYYYCTPEELKESLADQIDIHPFELYCDYNWGMHIHIRCDNPKESGTKWLVARWYDEETHEYKYSTKIQISTTIGQAYNQQFNCGFGGLCIYSGRSYDFAVMNHENDEAVADYYYSFDYLEEKADSINEYIKLVKYAISKKINPLKDNAQENYKASEVRRILYNRLISFRFSKDAVNAAIDQLENAWSATARDVYLLSVWDYDVVINATGDTSAFRYYATYIEQFNWYRETENTIYYLDSSYGRAASKMDFVNTLFHETGHAVDYNSLPGSPKCYTDSWHNQLIEMMETDISNMITICINRACQEECSMSAVELGFTNDQRDCIVNFLLGKTDHTLFNLRYNLYITQAQIAHNMYCDEMVDMVRKQIRRYLIEITTANRAIETRNACMVDAAIGMLHGNDGLTDPNIPLTDDTLFIFSHPNSYWDADGKKAILEGFAEFYASSIMGVYVENNKRLFNNTWKKMVSMLEAIKSNYLNNIYGNIDITGN